MRFTAIAATGVFFAVVVIAMASPCTARAADAPAETIRLWTGDAPAALGSADQDVPVIAWWPAGDMKMKAAGAGATPAMVVCPGGGYGGLADHEGSDYARWLTSKGISAFVLRYRLGSKGYRHPVMIGDVSRAMRLVRHHHERFGIDPGRVGVMGSSAGGHLALTLLTHGDGGDPMAADPVDREPSRADLGVLCYPVVSMLPEKTHSGSRKNLLGDAPTDEVVRELSGELAVTDTTPPVFIWHTFEDKAVKLGPILELAAALQAAKRPCELHVYEAGPHGLGLGVRPYAPTKTLHPWTEACGRWLGTHGF
jgi:acetyl esterase/lipase